VLDCSTEVLKEADEPDLAGQLAAFGRRYVHTDSITALQYYMLAAALAGGGINQQGKLFRELLVQSRDYGALSWGTGRGRKGRDGWREGTLDERLRQYVSALCTCCRSQLANGYGWREFCCLQPLP